MKTAAGGNYGKQTRGDNREGIQQSKQRQEETNEQDNKRERRPFLLTK